MMPLDFLNDYNFSYLNDGQVTRCSTCDSHPDSAIDSSIVSSHLAVFSEFLVIDDTFGSDHLPILAKVNTEINRENIIILEKWLIEKASETLWTDFRHLCRQELVR
jgi:hypothetical protein